MSVFEQCTDAQDTWRTFYTVACLCDSPTDMAALCGQARQALGADWAWGAREPQPYDIFCKLADFAPTPPEAGVVPRGYDCGSTREEYSFIDWGKVELVSRAAGVADGGRQIVNQVVNQVVPPAASDR